MQKGGGKWAEVEEAEEAEVVLSAAADGLAAVLAEAGGREALPAEAVGRAVLSAAEADQPEVEIMAVSVRVSVWER